MARAKKKAGPALAADGGEPQLVDIEDKQACQVYADWLQEKGDVRGQLMALQLADGDHYQQAQSFALEHRAELLGPVAAEIERDRVTMTVDFYRGFPRWLRLDVPNDDRESRGDLTKKLQRIPDLLGARFLQDIRVQSAIVFTVPATLLKLPGMLKLEFDNCVVRAIDEAAWEPGEGHCELRLQYCETDVDALFERLLVHGPGRLKVSVFAMGEEPGYAQDSRFKDVQAIGDDFAGDRAARAQLYVLNGGFLPDAPLPKTAGPAQLRFLNHSKKPIRLVALRWLEKTFPQVELPAKGAKVVLLGKPTYHDKDELAAAVKARGWTVAKTPKEATHALLMDAPGDALDAALAAKLPMILEARLNATVTSEAPSKPAAAVPAAAGGLADRLLSKDPKEALAAIDEVRTDAIPAPLLSPMFSAMCWSTDAGVRKAAKAALMAKGGKKAVGYLQGDRTNYAAIVDDAKLWKVTRELCDAVGLDQATFALHLVRMFAHRDEGWRADAPLSVAMRFPENDGKLFGWFAELTELFLPPLKKSFPKGLGAMKALQSLRVRGRVTSDANVDELAAIESFRKLEYSVADVDLRHLASLKDRVRELEIAIYTANLTDISPLRDWSRLESLRIPGFVSDLSPLAGKTTLSLLNVERSPLRSLDVVGGLTSLRALMVGDVAASLAPIAKLSGLEYLDASGSKDVDFGWLAGMKALKTLKLGRSGITDVSALAKLPLVDLDLSDTKVTDLTPLASIPTLKTLYLYRMPVADATLQGLKEALPSLQIGR